MTKKNQINKNKLKIKEMTISEFKKFLEGMEVFQEEDWSPNKEQWKLIKEIIYKLKENDSSHIKSNNNLNKKNNFINQNPQFLNNNLNVYGTQSSLEETEKELEMIEKDSILKNNENLGYVNKISKENKSNELEKMKDILSHNSEYKSDFI